jgi:pimeloyl-ACP methyl ester carboxylesterase
MRIPNGEGPFRTALLTVGIETGKDAIEMIEGHDSVLLMAVDYPFEGVWDFSGWNSVGTVFRLRSMAFRTVPLLLNCMDWLFTQKEVDRNEVLVVAVSFGTFTGVPAAVIDERVKQLVVVQGGGGLATVISSNAERWGTPVPGWLAGWLGSAILDAFEPVKYISHLSPRPLLMVNGVGDTFFPKESADRLFESADDPKEIYWHHTDHIMPGEHEVIKELTGIVVKKLYGD